MEWLGVVKVPICGSMCCVPVVADGYVLLDVVHVLQVPESTGLTWHCVSFLLLELIDIVVIRLLLLLIIPSMLTTCTVLLFPILTLVDSGNALFTISETTLELNFADGN